MYCEKEGTQLSRAESICHHGIITRERQVHHLSHSTSSTVLATGADNISCCGRLYPSAFLPGEHSMNVDLVRTLQHEHHSCVPIRTIVWPDPEAVLRVVPESFLASRLSSSSLWCPSPCDAGFVWEVVSSCFKLCRVF